jgi:two-component system CheB/CheR fusion protein
MARETRSTMVRYPVALAASGASLLARVLIDPWVHDRPLNALIYGAVAIAFWFGGAGPALLAAVTGFLGVHFVRYPGELLPHDADGWIGAASFFASCAILIALGEAATSSRRRLENQRRELERESADRAEAQDALRSSQQRELERRLELEALMSSAPAAIWVAHDPECRTITGNPAAAAMLGVPADINLARPAGEWDRTNSFALYRDGQRLEGADLPIAVAAREGCRVSDVELEFRFDDNRPSVWAYGNVEPLRDHRGALRGAIATFVDITERRRAEELQRETEARFRRLADQAPVLIWLNDLEGCVYVNREYLRFVGRSFEEVRGMAWAEAVHAEDVDGYLAAYRRALADRVAFDAQFRFRRADGEYRWMKSSGLPRLTTDGSLVGFVGCSFDITDVNQAIEALRESDRRKDEFLATLAHELRNPLAPLRNGLAILRLSGDGYDAAPIVGVMERQLAHLVRLVDDLVDVSRISRGKIGLRRERIDLASAMGEAAAIARPRIEEAGHRFTVWLPKSPVMVDGDPTRLAQVVANLLDNAAKYTDRGGEVRLSVVERDGEATVSVEDTGVGIAETMLPRIFDMFTQVDRPLDRSQGGLGIGLTLVKRLVEMHGGVVEASSEGAGRGSRFAVRIPIATDAAGDAAGEQAAAPRAEGAVARRVLVVDDNCDASSSLAAMLRLMGHDARTAVDGVEALTTAAAFRPDLVLLDIGMPRMNGYEVCRRIRLEPWGTKMRLVAVTGWGQEEDKRRAHDAGFDHHLTKPVDPAALARLLTAEVAPDAARASVGSLSRRVM